MEKTNHQKIGHIYRGLVRTCKRSREQCKYIKKQKKKLGSLSLNRTKLLAKHQAIEGVVFGLIRKLEDEFGFRERDRRRYTDKIRESHKPR